MLEIRKAVRRAIPMQIGFYAPSGAGKTLSAILMAAGLSPKQKIVIVDTERSRASLYSDNKRVLAVLPNGFDVIELDPPYHPKRYIEAFDLAESSGYEVVIVDSGSDSWDGPGGCCDLSEQNKGMWNIPKLWNKRMMTRASTSDMNVIWCLKAQDKTKIIDKSKSVSGKQEYIELGTQPIWEKNNLFSLLLVFSVDPKTHLSTVVKCHDDLWDLFKEPKLITKEDGERLRLWNQSGKPMEDNEQLKKRAHESAIRGLSSYESFFKSLTPDQRKALSSDHAANKKIAEDADKAAQQPLNDAAEFTPEQQRELDRLAAETQAK